MTPVEVLSDKPVGSEPEYTDHVIGVAPVATRFCENDTARYTVFNADVVITGAAEVTEPV
jgi:hypothetical protein